MTTLKICSVCPWRGGSEGQISQHRQAIFFTTSKVSFQFITTTKSLHQKWICVDHFIENHNVKNNIEYQTNQTFDIVIILNHIGKIRTLKRLARKETFDVVIFSDAIGKIRTSKCLFIKKHFDKEIFQNAIGRLIHFIENNVDICRRW